MPELSEEDQRKVDQYTRSNVNAIERKPFRPWLLLFIVFICLGILSVVGYFVASDHGVL